MGLALIRSNANQGGKDCPPIALFSPVIGGRGAIGSAARFIEMEGGTVGLFEFLAMGDWISPLIALGEMAVHGVGWTFYLDLDSGWTGAQCEKLLRSKGVKVYGRLIAKGDVFFQVPKRQAEYAEALLLKAGAPLKYHLFSEKNLKYIGGGGQQKVGFLDSIMNFLASL